jgi:hypothetical protein
VISLLFSLLPHFERENQEKLVDLFIDLVSKSTLNQTIATGKLHYHMIIKHHTGKQMMYSVLDLIPQITSEELIGNIAMLHTLSLTLICTAKLIKLVELAGRNSA